MAKMRKIIYILIELCLLCVFNELLINCNEEEDYSTDELLPVIEDSERKVF
jgi:hypothetical protein